MKSLFLLITLTLFYAISMGQTSADSQAVKKVILAYQDDFNKGAFANAEKYTTTDWVHINPGGGITRGRNAVLNEVRAVHQSFLKGVSMTVDTVSIQFLSPTVSVANVIHKISPYELPKGNIHRDELQVKTYIIAMKGGRWLITHDHNTIVQAPK